MTSSDAADISEHLARLKRGEQQALADLFARYREPLRRMIDVRLDHRLNGRVSPSDVLQEAYIDALKRIEHYFAKPEMPFFLWLRWVAGQRLIEVHRQHLEAQIRSACQEISLTYAGVPAASSECLAARLVEHLTSPSEALVRAERFAMLEDALAQMEPLDREVLTLRHFEEMSNTETAAVLGIQPAAASKRYVRALRRLKDILTDIPGFLDDPS
ncbi:MAG TPA: sigma-70 family RNA polymerase sigma factor [Gemmataceae bacterium]|nr:sigma-70 family RNA polymerase sigma factor [Gemmataceae bacterium]